MKYTCSKCKLNKHNKHKKHHNKKQIQFIKNNVIRKDQYYSNKGGCDYVLDPLNDGCCGYASNLNSVLCGTNRYYNYNYSNEFFPWME